MGHITGTVAITPLPKEDIWITDEAFSYIFEDMGIRTTIPKGFRTDGASIPRLFWRIIGHPFEPKVARAAVVHDYLYSKECDLVMDRKKADRAFRNILKSDGVGVIKRNLMYFGVRVGGWATFCKNNEWTLNNIIN